MSEKELSDKVWQDPVYFLAFGFGSGLMPVAPGTWGTLAAIPVYLLFCSLPPLWYLLFTAVLLVIASLVSHKVSKDLQQDDFGGIVIDEMIGFLLTMFMAPAGWGWILSGFILFRLFDIWKPWPVYLVEKHVPGGLGVVLDDVLAAVPAFAILQVLAVMVRS